MGSSTIVFGSNANPVNAQNPLLTPEGTEKVLQEAFPNGHFNNLKLLDHDAVFTPDPPH